ncbi:MAG: hypothetical protein HIU92_18090 [Proteobacteria bacterium]|nr:hypothetical protein [Pseudomonadota bacterium]
MNRLLALSLAAATALPVSALAAAPQTHVRGTVSSISDNSMTVHTNQGQDVTLGLSSSTHYVTVSKSSLSAINKNTYIGTATKDVGSQLIALEVVVFPNSMRGAGEGHYAWDPLPDTTLAGGGKVASTMTNGTVSTAMGSGSPTKVDSTMTNGTVSTDKSAGGAVQLTVTYNGGEQHILVPPTAPIVMLAPGKMSDVAKGDAVVVTEAKNNSGEAAVVAVGVDGTVPPM